MDGSDKFWLILMGMIFAFLIALSYAPIESDTKKEVTILRKAVYQSAKDDSIILNRMVKLVEHQVFLQKKVIQLDSTIKTMRK